MNLEDIKKEAIKNDFKDLKSLSIKVTELKEKGVSFLGCVAFIQTNKNISLKEARVLTLQLDTYGKEEKKKIEYMNGVMLSEFEEE